MKPFRIIALAMLIGIATNAHADLKAGANVTDITPLAEQFPLSAAGSMRATFIDKTDERIHCRTIMLGNDDAMVSFTIVDSCLIPREIADAAKRLASQQTGVPAANMTVAASHSHSAPTATPAFQSNPSVGLPDLSVAEDR